VSCALSYEGAIQKVELCREITGLLAVDRTENRITVTQRMTEKKRIFYLTGKRVLTIRYDKENFVDSTKCLIHDHPETMK